MGKEASPIRERNERHVAEEGSVVIEVTEAEDGCGIAKPEMDGNQRPRGGRACEEFRIKREREA